MDADQEIELEALLRDEGCPSCQRLPRSEDYRAVELGWEYDGNQLTDELCRGSVQSAVAAIQMATTNGLMIETFYNAN